MTLSFKDGWFKAYLLIVFKNLFYFITILSASTSLLEVGYTSHDSRENLHFLMGSPCWKYVT